MRRGRLQPKHVSFRWLLEMSVVHILSQICRQGVPHTRTSSRETFVAETVVRVERHVFFETRTEAESCRLSYYGQFVWRV